MGGADVDVGLGGHAGMADAVRAPESAQVVLPADGGGVAQILDQLQRAAQGEDLRAFHVLDVAREMLHVAVEGDDVAHRVLGGRGAVLDGDPLLGEPAVDFFHAGADPVVDVEAGGHVLLLGHLEAHHVVALGRRAVDREAGRIGSAVAQRLQHRGHLGADAAHAAPVNHSCNSAHVLSSVRSSVEGSRGPRVSFL